MHTKNDIVKFGILGTGWMADIFAQELEVNKRTEPVGVASGTPRRAALFAEAHPTAKVFESLEALIAAEEVDVVYLATTTNQHFENALTCVEQRKPVLVEKPLTVTAEQARALISDASRNRVFCMEAMWMRCFPQIRNLETVLAPIGNIHRLDASFCLDIPFDKTHRLYDPNLGGGALLDVGIYPLHLLHRLWGFDDFEMTCRLESSPLGTDNAGVMTFVSPDGRGARLDYSLNGQEPHRATFFGEKGTATLDDFFHPSKLTVEVIGAPPSIQTYSYPVMGYQYEIEEVVECLDKGRIESELVPLSTSLDVIVMMERILESLNRSE